MIYYRNKELCSVFRKLCRLTGSVFPPALAVAFPCGVIAFVLKYFEHVLPSMEAVVNNGAWNGFNVLVGFLIIFRTSQSYTRFWDGCTATKKMESEWWCACSALVSFTKFSDANDSQKHAFGSTIIRLFSMLHAAAWGYIEDSSVTDVNDVEAFKFELIDAAGIDSDTLVNLRDDVLKVELVYQWIQLVMVEAMKTGVLSIPAPVLSRSFQELSNGIVAFHDAAKISNTPFPFPYAQMCETVLLIHWLMVPFVVYGWVPSPFWAGALSFVQVFVLWSINFTSLELENPFGLDPNDLDGRSAQIGMNQRLCLLLRPHAQLAPHLLTSAIDYHTWADDDDDGDKLRTSRSFREIWQDSNHYSGELDLNSRHASLKRRSQVPARIPDTTMERNSPPIASGEGSPVPALRRKDSAGSVSSWLPTRPGSVGSAVGSQNSIESNRHRKKQPAASAYHSSLNSFNCSLPLGQEVVGDAVSVDEQTSHEDLEIVIQETPEQEQREIHVIPDSNGSIYPPPPSPVPVLRNELLCVAV